MESDDICGRYGDNPGQLYLKVLEQNEDEKKYRPLILIEGNRRTLEFLSEILAAMAKNEKDYKKSIAPDSAGCVHFDKNSQLGLYIHRLPG